MILLLGKLENIYFPSCNMNIYEMPDQVFFFSGNIVNLNVWRNILHGSERRIDNSVKHLRLGFLRKYLWLNTVNHFCKVVHLRY